MLKASRIVFGDIAFKDTISNSPSLPPLPKDVPNCEVGNAPAPKLTLNNLNSPHNLILCTYLFTN